MGGGEGESEGGARHGKGFECKDRGGHIGRAAKNSIFCFVVNEKINRCSIWKTGFLLRMLFRSSSISSGPMTSASDDVGDQREDPRWRTPHNNFFLCMLNFLEIKTQGLLVTNRSFTPPPRLLDQILSVSTIKTSPSFVSRRSKLLCLSTILCDQASRSCDDVWSIDLPKMMLSTL